MAEYSFFLKEWKKTYTYTHTYMYTKDSNTVLLFLSLKLLKK